MLSSMMNLLWVAAGGALGGYCAVPGIDADSSRNRRPVSLGHAYGKYDRVSCNWRHVDRNRAENCIRWNTALFDGRGDWLIYYIFNLWTRGRSADSVRKTVGRLILCIAQ